MSDDSRLGRHTSTHHLNRRTSLEDTLKTSKLTACRPPRQDEAGHTSSPRNARQAGVGLEKYLYLLGYLDKSTSWRAGGHPRSIIINGNEESIWTLRKNYQNIFFPFYISVQNPYLSKQPSTPSP